METLRLIGRTLANLPRSVVLSFAAFLAVLLLLYYPIGMVVMNRIDDNAGFKASPAFDVTGGSHTVAITEALIAREVGAHHWTPADPFFYPSALLVRMPAFQRGVLAGLSRMAIELSTTLGHQPNAPVTDPDLEKAALLLQYSPNIWLFDFSSSLFPVTPSKEQYQSAVTFLRHYNERLAANQAAFNRRSGDLAETLGHIGEDMNAASASIDTHIHVYIGRFIDPEAANAFYFTKGRMYADYLLLRELKRDFSDVILEKQASTHWDAMVNALREGSQISHFCIFNANPGSLLLPNHLAVQGFYLLRAHSLLEDVVADLQK